MSRPTLVLVPGMDGTGELFAPLVAALGDFSIRIVRYAERVGDEADAIVDAVRDLGEHIVVAESFGGPLAIRYAARRPHGLRGLVLAATFVTSPVPRAYAALLGLVPGIVFDRPPPSFVVRLAMVGTSTDASSAEVVRQAIARVPSGRIASRIRRLGATDLREAARSVEVPILSIRPTRDRLVGPAASEELRSVLASRAGSRHVEVAIDAPHLVFQTAADECAGHVRTFVDELDPSGASEGG